MGYFFFKLDVYKSTITSCFMSQHVKNSKEKFPQIARDFHFFINIIYGKKNQWNRSQFCWVLKHEENKNKPHISRSINKREDNILKKVKFRVFLGREERGGGFERKILSEKNSVYKVWYYLRKSNISLIQ